MLQTALNVKSFPHLPVSFIRGLQVYIKFWVQFVSEKISFSPHRIVECFHAITIDAKHLYILGMIWAVLYDSSFEK